MLHSTLPESAWHRLFISKAGPRQLCEKIHVRPVCTFPGLSLLCKWEVFQPAIGLPYTCWHMQERCPCRVTDSSPNVRLNQHPPSLAIYLPYPLFRSLWMENMACSSKWNAVLRRASKGGLIKCPGVTQASVAL